MEERSIFINGQIYRYLERKGKGPKLLFLHGLSDFSDQFLPISKLLPLDWYLLALDQRGHGGSYKPTHEYAPKDYAKDIGAFLNLINFNSIHIFGHSMGGRNGLIFASLYPNRIQSLILGDIGPDKNLNDIKETTTFFNNLPDFFNTTLEATKHFQKRKPDYSSENIKILLKNLKINKHGKLEWCFSKNACVKSISEARSKDWWDLIPKVKCPVLLIHVNNSSELPNEIAFKMQKKISDIEYVKMKNSGHNFHLENPKMASKAIVNFINNLYNNSF